MIGLKIIVCMHANLWRVGGELCLLGDDEEERERDGKVLERMSGGWGLVYLHLLNFILKRDTIITISNAM